jgi:hypothetical protein
VALCVRPYAVFAYALIVAEDEPGSRTVGLRRGARHVIDGSCLSVRCSLSRPLRLTALAPEEVDGRQVTLDLGDETVDQYGI